MFTYRSTKFKVLEQQQDEVICKFATKIVEDPFLDHFKVGDKLTIFQGQKQYTVLINDVAYDFSINNIRGRCNLRFLE
jgi:hypothetical protein